MVLEVVQQRGLAAEGDYSFLPQHVIPIPIESTSHIIADNCTDIATMPQMEQNYSGRVYLGTNGYVVSIDAATGQQVWRTFLESGSSFFGSTSGEEVTILEAGEILLAGCYGHLFALNINDGSVLWHNPLEGLGNYPVSLAGFGQAIQYIQRTVRSG